ncbi:MAG: SpoIIE family protein phosphatase [Candidatus Eremiobacteraeota bacterium]|nr:SpoIIE family protein phosphatase [Candidatus Eremiobacteraeota bacterium]
MRHVSLAVLVLLIFTISTLWVRSAIETDARLQAQLQAAEFERGRLLKLQLDEETGIRGYAATGARVFLQPYREALPLFEPSARSLESLLTALSIGVKPLERERAINRMWRSEVASPILRRWRGVDRSSLELTGKSLVDDFRDNDRQLVAEINAKSNQAGDATARIITRVLTVGVLFGVLVVVVVALYWSTQRRLVGRLEERNVAFERERLAAELLQSAFVRRELPAFPGASFAAAYLPAREEARVGGDWYDAYQLSDERVLFSIGDVAGHGLEAAVVMSRVRQSIAAVGTYERDPAVVLARANDTLLLQDSRMVTATCGFVDVATGTVSFANAGHPPMLLLAPDRTVERLSTPGPPLGATDRPTYTSALCRLVPNSLLVLYTDGLIEHGRDAVAGEEQLAASVQAIDVNCKDPAGDILRAILPDSRALDDVAILTIAFHHDVTAEVPERCA